jgi:hypothetical protein
MSSGGIIFQRIFCMDRDVSIVKVDTRPYRTIARENWGLTSEQMKGKHVHHRIPVSEEGTNDPTNLYVCGPWFHSNVWHSCQYFIEKASEAGQRGARKGHEKKNKEGKSEHAVKMGQKGGALGDRTKKSEGAKRGYADKNEEGKSTRAVINAKKGHSSKNSDGKSIRALNMVAVTNKQKWKCLVTGKVSTSGPLTLWQKKRGIDPTLRVRIG